MGLPGLGDGDLEAEGLDLADVVADLPVGVGACLVVAGAEVGVPGGGVGQQVPDDDQDGAGDGDLGFGLAAAAGDPPVALAEEGAGAGGAGGGLAEVAAQPAVALVLLLGGANRYRSYRIASVMALIFTSDMPSAVSSLAPGVIAPVFP
jgi:hypothetical protein